MRRLPLLLLATACACSGEGDDEDLGAGAGTPDEWDAPACSWEDRVDRPEDVLDTAVDVAITSDRGLVVASEIADGGGRGMWLRRYQAGGEVSWTRETTGDVVSGHIAAVAIDADDRVGVTGEVDEEAGRLDFWIAAYEADGEPLWSIDLDTGGGGADACFAPDGALYVTGAVRDPDFQSGTLIWTGKLSAADGELVWSHAEAGGEAGRENGGQRIVCDADGGATVMARIAVPGGPESSAPDAHTWIRRYDGSGEEVWTRTIGEEFEDSAPGTMMPDPGGGLLVTSGGRLYRLETAGGTITSDTPGFGAAILAADEGGAYIEGNFAVREDPDCVEPENVCDVIPYWGYAYVDWRGELVWWRADTARDVDVSGAVQAIAVEERVLAVAGRADNDIWVCYE